MNKNYLLQLKKDKKVMAIYQFGSYGTKKYNPYLSDVDICIFTADTSPNSILKLHSFGSEKVDISLFDHLPIYLKPEVFKGKPLFIRDSSFISRKFAIAFREYQDFKKYNEKYWKELKKRGAN
ncbi:MAG: nucleotidyltransferase domain-containing protein [Nanoarchaeota archaeon]